MGAIGTTTSTGANRAAMKANEKALVVAINTVGTCGDTTRDNIGAGDDDVGSLVLDTGTCVIQESDAAGGILTSMGTVAILQVLHDNILMTARDGIPSSGGKVVLLRDGGFEWPIGSTLGTRTLNTMTSGDGSRGKHLATDDNLDRSGLSGKSSCGLGGKSSGGPWRRIGRPTMTQ
ncbi:hypothetical protein GUJ93_ZPchr0012g20243 [Zizania palustris]|uniref:Uncharacterized protein n=1 Tax=Zizania palustris TaxID=103762 RepID=A0A8J6BX90_ZIZPA|nr:hypothetical protein GUJ93_ZPchr0012g20243 [Zizania palustris]